jgi:hypothetical protein
MVILLHPILDAIASTACIISVFYLTRIESKLSGATLSGFYRIEEAILCLLAVTVILNVVDWGIIPDGTWFSRMGIDFFMALACLLLVTGSLRIKRSYDLMPAWATREIDAPRSKKN